MTMRVVFTIIASRATIPERVGFRSNRHCGASGADGAAYEDVAMRESRGRGARRGRRGVAERERER